jgi:acetyl-CoA acetyltransferase
MTGRGKNKDIAIVGIGSSQLSRDSGKSLGQLALEATRAAICDSGLKREMIDGVSSIYSTDLATAWHGYVIEGLGLDNLAWISTSSAPSMNAVGDGIHAVAAGVCKYALCYHAKYRWDVTSASARKDPMRRSAPTSLDPTLSRALVEPCAAPVGFAALMRRHMHDYGSKREHFGKIVVNNQTNAQQNERALCYGQPLTMDDYMESPTIYEPFNMHDMDAPVDGAMAVVVTTADRAADLPSPAVFVDATAYGVRRHNDMIFQPFDTASSQKLLMDTLWEKSSCTAADIDLANVYDGFSILALTWIEAAFCGLGEGPGFIDDAWDPNSQTLRLYGRIPVCTHGGNLGEGRVQGIGHLLEAVTQLRGRAGSRQIGNPRRALVTNGSNPVNIGMILSSTR